MAMSMGAEWSSAGEGKALEGEQMQPAVNNWLRSCCQ